MAWFSRTGIVAAPRAIGSNVAAAAATAAVRSCVTSLPLFSTTTTTTYSSFPSILSSFSQSISAAPFSSLSSLFQLALPCRLSASSSLRPSSVSSLTSRCGSIAALQPLVQPCRHMAAMIRPKPRTPGQRHAVFINRSALWKGRPIRKLTTPIRKQGGRNNSGKITVHHRGGGHKRRYRIIDFKRAVALDSEGTVERIEYDPNRSAFIALISYADVQKQAYIIAPQNLDPGMKVFASRTKEVDIRVGNAMPLGHMPVGTEVCCVELLPGKGAQIARSAGTSCQLLEKDFKSGYALLRLHSQEHRKFLLKCLATVGVVSNPDHQNIVLGKAGRKRWLGWRPTVRGVAMNPIDHPHGGGEGRNAPGRPSVTPWGLPTKGYRTRSKRKHNKNIIKRRFEK